MLILHDPDTLLHETVELLGSRLKHALECPARIRDVVEKATKSHHALQYVESPLTNAPALQRLLQVMGQTHDGAYLDHLKNAFKNWREAQLVEPEGSILPECFVYPNKAHARRKPPMDIFAQPGYFAFDMSSGIMAETYRSTIASANLAFQAVQQLMDKPTRDVVALSRPPGHHCDGARAGGYCYVNNTAVGISTRREHAPDARVGILDIDFHHGNGTQEIYYSDSKTLYTSIHGKDEFPYYTGMADETGTGDAVGMNLNLPLETGSSFECYLEKVHTALSALSDFRADMLVVSLGFDTFHLDPLGNFEIQTDDYETLARTVRRRLPDVPAVILLEGGYVVEHLGCNLMSFLKGWEAKMER